MRVVGRQVVVEKVRSGGMIGVRRGRVMEEGWSKEQGKARRREEGNRDAIAGELCW